MSSTSTYSIALVAILSVGTTVHAQTDNTAGQQTRGDTLDTLETVGQIEYQTGDVINEETALNSATISREQLSRSTASLAKLISHETGVQYMQSGGFGSYATVSIRAASAAQTGVYLDGILLNSGGNPVIDLSTLEILNLGSVDVYRGGTPSQLGHGGIGGAVNLNTLRTDRHDPASRIRLEYGSLSQAGIQASHQISSGKWDLVAAASRRQSDNDFTYLNKNGTPLNLDDDQIQSRNNSQVQRSSALLRAGYQHSADSRTDFTAQLGVRKLGVPEWRNQINNQSSYDSDSSQLQLSHVIDNIGGWNSRQGIYRHSDENHYQDPLGQIGLGIQDTLRQMRVEGAKSYWEYLTDSGTLGLSVEYRQEMLTSDERLGVAPDYDADRNQWLATAHYTWYDATESLTISPTIRWQHAQFNGARTLGTASAADQNNGSQFGTHIGLVFQSSDSISFSANIGSYHRAPSFGELYGSIGLVNGNPDLIPEEGLNADMGIVYSGRLLELRGTVFASYRDELIVTSFDSRGVGQPVNSGAAEVLGVELGTTWTVSPQFSISSNLTWQSPRSVDRAAGFYNRFLPGEAQLAWYGRAEYHLANWTAQYDVNVHHKRFYDRANILPAANTTLHAVSVAWDRFDWQFSLSANNLGNETVEDFNGFPKPGRTFQFVTSYAF